MLRLEVEAEGTEPVIAAASWTLPGELAFYCRGNPVVYSVGLILGDRHSQYDLWRPNPVEDSALFVGRTFCRGRFASEHRGSVRKRRGTSKEWSMRSADSPSCA